jgi:hypothetical protein
VKKGGSTPGIAYNEQRLFYDNFLIIPEKNIIKGETEPGDTLQKKIENRCQDQEQCSSKGESGPYFVVCRYGLDKYSKQ